MHFKRGMFTAFVIFGAAVFILGRINSPMLVADRTFLEGIDMRSELRDLRYLILTSIEDDAPESKEVEDKIGQVESSLEVILDEARRRHYSKWLTDTLAASVIVLGLIVTLVASWRADTKRTITEAEQAASSNH
jgi:hypothetical protein